MLKDIQKMLERLTIAVIGDALDPRAPPGLLQRQHAQESHLADHEQRITAIEEGTVARDAKTGDRAWAIGWDLAKAIGAGVIGAFVATKGPHP